MSEVDQREYSGAVEALLVKAASNLSQIESRRPNAKQRQAVDQVRVFIAQSKEARGRDLVAAKSLAERAEILSRDLLSKLR